MKFYSILLAVITSFFILGCSSTEQTVKNSSIKTRPQITHSVSTNLDVEIPVGWREIKDNSQQLFDIWLVHDNRDASISFIQIHISDKITLDENLDKIDLVERVIVENKKHSAEEFRIINTQNMNTSFPSKMLNISINESIQNIIIFGDGKRFYECLAYFNKGTTYSESDYYKLIETQQQIVSTAIIK